MHHSPPPPSSLPQSRIGQGGIRNAKQLPVQLLDHCTVCLEEQLYSQAFSLLSSALTSGTGTEVEAHIPPAQHLALAATLVVHPQLTTRTTSPDKHAAADEALSYLRHVNSLLDSQISGLDKAFQFNEGTVPSRGKRTRTRLSEVASDEEDEKYGHVNSSYTGKESLWTNAEDFWSIVGWAFNCSVAHRQRWDRWKLLLAFMLDVLEDDLEARLPNVTKAFRTGGTAAVEKALKDSLFAQYLSPIGEGRNNKRRLMRAILADGKQKSLAEFGEIWKRETKAPKQKQDERAAKRRKLDLDNGEFGDYFDEESEGESREGTARRSRSVTAASSKRQSRAASADQAEEVEQDGSASPATTSGSATSVEAYGGMESIHRRQRLLALLTRFCAMNPDAFLDTEDLFDLFTEFLRPLPLPVFQQFILPTRPYLGPNSQTSLNQMVLRPLLVATAPVYNENSLSQAEFETHYAPYAANNTSAVDNAKVSLLIEALLRLLWTSGSLNTAQRLRRLVRQGITARSEKVEFDGRKKVENRSRIYEEARTAMDCSAERMLVILDMAE